MAHTVRDKQKLLNRVRRIRGQLDGVERALDEEREGSEILRQIAACRGALNGLMLVVLEGHVLQQIAQLIRARDNFVWCSFLAEGPAPLLRDHRQQQADDLREKQSCGSEEVPGPTGGLPLGDGSSAPVSGRLQ